MVMTFTVALCGLISMTWTPMTMHNAATAMNDYHGVKNSDDTVSWKFLPKHACEITHACVGYLQVVMDNYREAGRTDNRVVVITHHAPSKRQYS
jgi:hypothetical protein